MTVIKAPYNFVPFNQRVVSPHWIDQISHDVPFKDGLSGKIEVKLTAMSPIFVRDGIGQKAAEDNYVDGVQQKAHTFSQTSDGRYFIPGTSLKGMIRSVLEILSFGRMEGKVNDHRYALRDLSGAMQNQYLAQFKPDKIRCGWLKKNDDNTYSIRDCGTPGRIGHDEIDAHFKTNFVSYFGDGGGFNPKKDQEKAAQKKYQLFGDTNQRRQSFSETTFPAGVMDGGRTLYNIDPASDEKGTIVFTGQPGVRKKNKKGKWTGHFYEFIFFEEDEIQREVDEKVMEAFFFAYYEHDPTKWSEDWKVWRKKLHKEEIPIFFHLDNKGNVSQLGLSYLYKLPYKYSVLESIAQHQGKGKADLSEALFGHVIDGKEQLRGRVHIGHAFSENAKPADHEVKEVLSGPKASYFPTYIRQAVKADGTVDTYNTFMKKGAEIAGWKRYPIHQGGVKHNDPPDKTDSEKITTKFKPLQAGAEFTFTLRYHNLRSMELGALLSALTFHRTTDTFHVIGMAKPLGYGKVKVEILNLDEEKIKASIQAFEAYMNAQPKMPYGTKWHEAKQVKELVTMAQAHEGADLSYMPLKDHMLAKNKKDKDFKDKSYEALAPYSQLVKAKTTVPTYCDEAAIQEMRRLIEAETRTGSHRSNIEEVISSERGAAHSQVESKFPDWKQALLQQLSEKKEAREAQEREDKLRQLETKAEKEKEAKRKKYQQEGPDLASLDPASSKAFAELIKQLEDFGRVYHQQNDKQIKSRENHPDGFLPEPFHEKLLSWLELFTQEGGGLKPHDRRQWLKKGLKDSDMKRLAEWVGEQKARAFLEKLNA